MPRFPQPQLPPSPGFAMAAIFLVRGFMLGNWFPRIPGVADRLDIASSQLGILMFLLAAGCVLSFGIAAKTIRAQGSRRSILFFSVGYPLTFCLAGLAPTIPLLALSLIAFGFLGGGYDVSCSVQAGIIERRTRKPLISALYGYFSLGTLLGSVTGGMAAQWQVPLAVQFGIIGAIVIPAVSYLTTRLLPDEKRTPITSAPKRRRVSLPPKAVLPFGVMIICVALGEESINNWVALYLRQDLGTSAAVGSFAYTIFAVTTFVGRIFGDKVIARLGVDRVLMTGSLLAAFGVGLGVLINQPWSVLAGYAAVGTGLSIVVPITYRTAGNIPGIAPGDAVAAVATIGYTGYLLGPILIGVISDLFSLRFALALIALSLLGIFAMVRVNRTEPAPAPEQGQATPNTNPTGYQAIA